MEATANNLTTDKEACRILVALLERHGVSEAVVSPGSRNAPLLLALAAARGIACTVVVDERSAAFIALGKATALGKPVALVCTSGTALLNYAPAVAEAYYRKAALIVVSADRPAEWIDQDDSQTLRQREALAHYVKGSYDIPADCSSEAAQWYANRQINDALLMATSGRRAPVHINVQLDAPLGGLMPAAGIESRWQRRTVAWVSPMAALARADAVALAREVAASPRVLIIAGFHDPDPELRRHLESLTQRGNVAVMTETIANLPSPRFIGAIDSLLSTLSAEERSLMAPDLVITLGGAIVSRFIKQYLRQTRPREHWHVGLSNTTIDCFQSLTRRIEMEASCFFGELLAALGNPGDAPAAAYHEQWMALYRRAAASHSRQLAAAPWSDLRAVAAIMRQLPAGVALQLSNGTSVRYAQLFPAPQCARADCNRGVSGIDGSTSTAIGAASAMPERLTLLLTGDMSMQYDIGALAAPCIPPTLRIAVLCNGGGGIFRFIDATRQMPILERFLVADRPLPLRQLAEAYGFNYLEATSEEQLTNALHTLFSPANRPTILAIHTDGTISASTLRAYLNMAR